MSSYAVSPARTFQAAEEFARRLKGPLLAPNRVEDRFVLGDESFRGSVRGGGASAPCIDKALEKVTSSRTRARLLLMDAPETFVVSDMAHGAYAAFRATDSKNEIPTPTRWMNAQAAICNELEKAGLLSEGQTRDFRHWARVARLADIIRHTFERSNDVEMKLSREGLPTIYVGKDRAHTAHLSAAYMNSVVDHLGRLYGVFACDTSNVDVYQSFMKQGGKSSRFGLATHLDEYVLTNIEKERLLTGETYPESFVYILRQIWDEMGIPRQRRLEIDGLSDRPEEVAAAIETIHSLLQTKKAWGLAILGLGPEERPHIGFVDDLGHPPQFFTPTRRVLLSDFVQKRDIERGQQPHAEAISAGTGTIVGVPLIQQTWYVDQKTGDAGKSRGYVTAHETELPNRYCSTAISQVAWWRWNNFTDSVSVEPILASGLYPA